METNINLNDADLTFANCGSVIREARNKANVSIRELADRLDCDRGRLSKIETNALPLSLAMLEQIAEHLGEKPEVLIIKCLERRFPKLRSNSVGVEVLKLFSALE